MLGAKKLTRKPPVVTGSQNGIEPLFLGDYASAGPDFPVCVTAAVPAYRIADMYAFYQTFVQLGYVVRRRATGETVPEID